MPSPTAYLAMDLGAESGRAIVGVLDGGKVTIEELHRFRHEAEQLEDGLHWDFGHIRKEVFEGARKAFAWAKEQGLELHSLGVDTWGVDIAFLGDDGEFLQRPFCYRDPRNGPAFKKLVDTLGASALYEATGIQFMQINTLPQLIAQQDADPSVLERTSKMLFIPDLLHRMFCGSTVTEYTIASTSQMIDPRTRQWNIDLLQRLNLPTDFLPEIVPAGSVLGTILPEVAAQLGAPEGLKVITPGSHDTAAAIAAVPVGGDRSWCYLSSGTWSLMGAEIPEPCLTEAAQKASFTNEGGFSGEIRFLKNITGLWMVQECRRYLEAQEGKELDYADMVRDAEAGEPFRTIVDTDHGPFLEPGDMLPKIDAFARETNQPEPKTAGEAVRCCLESLALTYRRTLERLESVLDQKFEVLHIVGGGTQNKLLNQMTANATGREVITGPAEATAIGNILIQAYGAGHVSSREELRQIVADSFPTETYQPQDAEAWNAAYERYQSVCK
ncbi:rhamnulokinase [Calycomorphotria hydatis]|uniref:Rhamnulokinase n=1 Tax=Calycomorphotria hydatis TaxID=2528027 RepID=A0A517T7A9_9PLAN|nr:rhamnulokinase family protein [Calycomorphotria hydatis]QDT64264.1 Rhamnulokinase [Calycomorphotria hydatis]